MILEDLQERYGDYLAEIVRQTLTLEDFQILKSEELITHFEKKSQRAYESYRSREKTLPPEHGPVKTQSEYLSILRRRWEEAEDMAYEVLKAEKDACDREASALEA